MTETATTETVLGGYTPQEALLAEALTLMHAEGEALPPEWVRLMLTRERTEADREGRLHTFGGRGRWLRLLAPAAKPLLTELTAAMVVAGLARAPLHPGY